MGLFLTVLFFKWSPRTGYQRNNFRLKMKVSQFVDKGHSQTALTILVFLDHLLSTYPRICLNWGGNSFSVIGIVENQYIVDISRLHTSSCQRSLWMTPKLLKGSSWLCVRDRPRFFFCASWASKPPMHLFEINVLSLNDVIARLTKIMNRADKNWAHFSKSFQSFQKISLL